MKPEDRKRLKGHIDMVMNGMDDINGIPENYHGHKGIVNDVNKPVPAGEVDPLVLTEFEKLRSEYTKLRVKYETLKFKESQEQRYIWWVYQVYARNVQDLILDIMGATTYDTEGEAKEGKYALPKHCFDLMKRLDEYTEHIYDGTYLDV
jgi:hypothetical protein